MTGDIRNGVWEHVSVNEIVISVREALTPGQLIYDCSPWAGESRRLFKAMLDAHGLTVSWAGTEVLVAAADREIVDDLVDQIVMTASAKIGSDEPGIVYEIGTWPDALQTEFTDQLTISEVSYAWDTDGNIVVAASDEEAVDEVLELLPDPEDFDDVDGFEAQDRLNRAFRLCDRLAAKPADGLALDELRSVGELLRSMSPPFGFEQLDWDRLVDQVAEAAADDKLSDKSRAKRAKAAKKLLLNYV